MEHFLTIEIFGQSYTFKADTDDTSAKEIADHLVKEVAKVEMQQSNQTSNMTKLAILLAAALNITSEHVQLKRTHLELIEGISQRSASLVHTLDTVVKQ